MSFQQGHRIKRNYIFAILILFIGFGGLLGYDLYFKPYVLSRTVVKIKVGEGKFIPKNYELQKADLYLDKVQTKDIPSAVITEISQVEHKITNVNLSNGSILTESLIDVSELEPTRDEGVFAIPKQAIYGINGSLRSRDKVDLYLVKEAKPNSNELTPPDLPIEQAFLTNVTVNYVRTEDNNDVLDSENGNTNNRLTSTGKVASPELKLKKSDGQLLKQYLEQGFKLWIVRVE